MRRIVWLALAPVVWWLVGSCCGSGEPPCTNQAECGAVGQAICEAGACSALEATGDVKFVLGLELSLYHDIARATYSVFHGFDVLGEVVTPGRFELSDTGRVTVLQALSLAGGLDRFAAKDRIQVRRAGANGESVMIFDYEAVERGNAVELIELRDGDVVVVPERGLF